MLKKLVRASLHIVAVILVPNISPSQADVSSLLRDATEAFKRGQVSASISLWKEAVSVDPEVREKLWQLGLAQYVVGQYDECAEQFEYDYARNPNDTEEVIWAYLCNSKKETSEGNIVNTASAKSKMPAKQREDPRPIMRKVETAYRDGDVSTLQSIIRDYEVDGEVSQRKKH